MALALSLNAVTVLGVLAFGWPAGNVFVLFWVENAVLGAWTLVRILTARGTAGPSTRITVHGVPRTGGPGLLALFFCFHYGLFCLVHAVFTGFVAFSLGVAATFAFLGLPIVLIMIRYTVETITVWFGAGQRDEVSPARAMLQPYPRIIVLHVAVLIAFALVLSRSSQSSPLGGVLSTWGLADGPALVLMLIALKTVADVWTTKRATRT